MKKVFSISLSILMLAAMFHISIATHFCGGMVAASKISLSGKLASCGMEMYKRDFAQSGSSFVPHCCDNILASYGINDNYFPSFTYAPGVYQNTFQVFDYPVCSILHSLATIKSIYTSAGPPDAPVPKVDLSGVCVFRI